MTHTPAPWDIEHDRQDIHILGSDFVGGSQTIATFYTRSNGPDANAIAEANAKVAAAAPELLAIAIQAESDLAAKLAYCAGGDDIQVATIARKLEAVRAAIAKATGQ